MSDDEVTEAGNSIACSLDGIGEALKGEFTDSVPVGDAIADGLRKVAQAITPCVAGGTDQAGGHIESLTEAVMGITAGLVKIADALDGLAEAVRERP